MTENRIRERGDIKAQGENRAMHKTTSLPKVRGENVRQAIGIDPVIVSPQPAPSGDYKRVVRNGAVEDGGNWIQAWVEEDIFVTDSDGTKADKETAYQATLDAGTAERVRTDRDSRLALTDFHALSDTVMSEAMTTYRQLLRDVPAQAGFPNSITWPESP